MKEFTAREREVFELMGQGLSSREIAERLVVTVKTVEAHTKHMSEKRGLQVRHLRYEAIRAVALAEVER